MMQFGDVAVAAFGVVTILLFGATPILIFGLMVAGIGTGADGVDPIRWYTGSGLLVLFWGLDIWGWAALFLRAKRHARAAL